eukprot:scaffold34685_cov183-Amphora_coffeaeformis.AAC.34
MSSGVSIRHVAPDPGGFDPAGRQLLTGVEPVGQEPALCSPRLPNRDIVPAQQAPTPVNRGRRQNNDGSQTPVMALLMNSQPPTTGSPAKRRSSSRGRRSGEYSKLSPVSTAQTESTGGSGEPSPLPHHNNSAKNAAASLVEQRLRAARAIYESDALALPDEPPEYSVGRPSQAATPVSREQPDSSPTSSLATQQHRNTYDSSNETSLAAPHRGRNLESNIVSSTPGSSEKLQRRKSVSQPRRRSKTPEKRRSRTPDSKRKTPERRRRKTPERRRGEVEEEIEEQRKGFFRKLFRRNKKDAKTVDGSEMEDSKFSASTQSTSKKSSSVSAAPLPAVASMPVSSARAQSIQPSSNVDEMLWTSQSMPDGQPQQRRSNSRGRGPPQNPTTSMDESEVFFASDDVSTLTGPTIHEDFSGHHYHSHHRQHHHPSSYKSSRAALDPIEGLTQSTSTLSADPMGFYYTPNGSGAAHQSIDPEESYDESSMYASIHANSSSASGPIDPFTEPFFRSNKASGGKHSNRLHVITEPGYEQQLRQEHSDDPIGESPMSSRYRREREPDSKSRPEVDEKKLCLQDPSPRGYSVNPTQEHEDPFGVSPVHNHDRGPSALMDGTLHAPDPPLYQNNDDDDEESATPLDSIMGEYGGDDESRMSLRRGEEEKKDDDSVPPPPPPPPSTRMTIMVPPPPPPPPPGSKKKKSKRGPRIPKSPSRSPDNAESGTPRSAENTRSSTDGSMDAPSEDDSNSASSPPPPPPPPPPKEMSVKRSYNEIAYLKNARMKKQGPTAPEKKTEEPETSDSAETTAISPGQAAAEEKEKTVEIERAMEVKKKAEKPQETKNQARKPVVFDSDTGEPVEETPKGRKSYISSLARMNAKAVAYLHTLNGDPSPRHQWQSPSAEEATAETDSIGEDGGGIGFRAYSAKFKGRKLTTSRITTSPRSFGSKGGTPRSCRKEPISPSWADKPVHRDVRIHQGSVTRGVAIRKAQREALIAEGKAERIIPKPPTPKSAKLVPSLPEPRDPIQRAGRRLLYKAAVPIQAQMRRFLAQREAVDRMWALIEIQSYMRRWRAEAHMLACVSAVVLLQSLFRGFQIRVAMKKEKCAAIQVQRVVRGYLASVWAYDTVYSVILIQAQARRYAVRHRLALETVAAMEIQRIYKGYKIRRDFSKKKDAAVRLQAGWRMISAHQAFQFVVVDIIIAQSVVRAFLARRELHRRKDLLVNHAATKIQTSWRSFKGYTDYIFTVVDVVLVQKTCRCWLAKRRAVNLKKAAAATKIQMHWRRFHAQMKMLYDLVHIIMVQSVVRRHLAKTIAWKRRIEHDDESASAVRIQAAWRGFWQFSHYVIMQYEITRIQAAARGMVARKVHRLTLGSCILIQSVFRRCRARIAYANKRTAAFLVHSRASLMRESLACKKIQFWWRVVVECRKEKKAALTIERFFIMVKKEVEQEVKKFQEKGARRTPKSKRGQIGQKFAHRKRESDEQMLERVWLNTVDENHVDVFAVPSSARSYGGRIAPSPSASVASSVNLNPTSARYSKNSRYVAASPSMSSVNASPQSDHNLSSFSFSSTHLSNRVNELKEKVSKSGLSLSAGAQGVGSVEQEKKKRAADKYLKLYGVNTTPNRYAREFFTGESPMAVPKGRKSLGSVQPSDWQSPTSTNSRRTPSKAKQMAEKYLQQREMEREHKKPSNNSLRVDAILGDDIGLI